ncbi:MULTISPECIES: ATP-dependent zinc metalloprotease FtsH [unclassified Oceanobacter]|jgi:cell division protease FtsH|uniref:ATP-dependent zinc metalloprotease FtsH n=1 Tax=unclassified Oceanobacter TaxID=2620260 RepID=UPI0026E32812|nr:MULTISPECIES: ATP-dependent zinc metalloprotease FtsH [unclassified Oceanobacter]MDO6681350.1 ATP-dependent zinc metalloprotease FtsH [Oceanobacter sp. 5_MG-2023]MDP2505059.1 ATP-dependent zinc metalloprotease FtsH [Oceanobacter sp. 3_MG-2023]MDP2548183.1 ATP-dependent zinc metalloprotease FtsH [Oceanobacter sp. 4_MG-2023]MDP2608104.1 ATP-dependent zinc metalloprotease FtsH [Oceanobacter sp. 1_MG-2023]MDP2611234.1 ATP-dependent zinc metalloprotease FtsH [Oceanobacter sp. 2_MG-2023]
MAKNFVLWAVIAAVLMMVFNNFQNVGRGNELSYSEFITAVESGQVERVTIAGQNITGISSNGESFETVLPAYDDKLMDTLLNNQVKVVGEKPEKQGFFTQLLLASLPILIILAVFMFFMRQMQGGGSGRGGPMAFGKSKAKLLSEDQIKTTFEDVAGCDEAKEDVKELVEFLRDPGKYQRLGGKIPRGVLMVGQPGTGKTLLAKAIAGEAKVPFFSISGSDFVEMFVGVGASRVRDMFDQAKKQAPCIIFIDEIDAVGRSRGVGIGGGNDEREQTLNQLLVEMDGFEVNDGIIVIAATNRPDVLDPALLRPGRFDRQVVVGLPDIRGREQILKVHMRKVPVADNVNASLIARGTPGFSGADLANLVNEAALFAARANSNRVTMEEFEQAKDKILMGAERKTMVMSEKEKTNTAYHEAGHAIVGRLMPEHDPVYKVSIIPRGRALGVTMFLPEEDRHSISKRGIESNICSLYGGRIAEEMTLGKDGVTTGASNDIERATKYARNYVTKWGLSEKLGAQLYTEEEQQGYLGSGGGGQLSHLSDETARVIDAEIKDLLDTCYKRSAAILEEHRDKLELMKDALMEYETIDADQISEIMAGHKPSPPKSWDDRNSSGPSAPASEESRDMAKDPKDDAEGESVSDR